MQVTAMPEFFYTTAKNNQARPSDYFRTVPVAGSLGPTSTTSTSTTSATPARLPCARR
ncbi:hypothetical protein UMZ34_05480 [Halopseudomonas pachastrellae]|nr:hypothetical protein UMZ34_05480 [Halopseudomonas pachastrellae]